MTDTAIGDYAMLSDRHSAALVDREGSIDWLCCPRFDSPSIFGRLLGDTAGHWSLRAAGATAVARRYLERAMVLETTFRTATGVAVVVDGLATGTGNRGHDLGRNAPHLLVRQATCTEGEVDVEIEYVPRPEYGLVFPLLEQVEGGLADASGGADVLFLSSPIPLTIAGSSASGRFWLREGEVAAFALHHHNLADTDKARIWSQTEITARLDDTVAAWQSWSDLHQAYDGPWRELVQHSGRVLQALSFQPTGAICAAATTSLPEVVGGARNWDYRHAWVRDASFTIEALWVAACPDEANEFFDYVTASAAGAAGTAAMDYLLYRRYRSSGGKDSFWPWESAAGVMNWQGASAPGQLGHKFERAVMGRPPPDEWARATTNAVHWATGIGWGLQYGMLASRTSRDPWLRGLALGPTAWLASYVILPLTKVYKPIWDYDARTLGEDLSADLVYGAATAMTFAALDRKRS